MNTRDLLSHRADLLGDQTALLHKARDERRDLTPVEETEYQRYERSIASIEAEIRQFEGMPSHSDFDTDWTRFQRKRIESILPQSSSPHTSGYGQRTADNLISLSARYLRTGDPGALAELRASNDTSMNITTPADGGYAVPIGHYQQVVAKMRPQALYDRLGCLLIPGTGTTVNVPVDDESDDGAFVPTAEEGAFDRDAPAIGQKAMTLTKYTKKIEFSVELLEDEDSRLMDFINSYIAAGMAATMNSLLTTEALTSGTAGLTLDSASAIGPAEVPELLYKLKGEYVGPNTFWLMNRTVEGYLRGLTGNNFQFAPTPSGRTGATAELFGVPIVTDSHMPALGAGNKVMVVGNWSKMAYRLAPDLQILRDPYSLGHLGQVRLLCFFRTVFKLLQSESLQYATAPTA